MFALDVFLIRLHANSVHFLEVTNSTAWPPCLRLIVFFVAAMLFGIHFVFFFADSSLVFLFSFYKKTMRRVHMYIPWITPKVIRERLSCLSKVSYTLAHMSNTSHISAPQICSFSLSITWSSKHMTGLIGFS